MFDGQKFMRAAVWPPHGAELHPSSDHLLAADQERREVAAGRPIATDAISFVIPSPGRRGDPMFLVVEAVLGKLKTPLVSCHATRAKEAARGSGLRASRLGPEPN